MITLCNQNKKSPALMGVLTLLIVAGWVCLASAQVVLTSPLLPPESDPDDCSALISLYAGVDVDVTFPGPVVLSDPRHKCFANVDRANDGMGNEIELFDSVLDGFVTIGGSTVPVTLTGPVNVVVSGKIGYATGAFQTEIVAMSLTGVAGETPVILRESPTLISAGQTTITDLGGGQYQVDSFFDVYFELSMDGGSTFVPQLDGPGRLILYRSDDPTPVEISATWSGIKAVYR